jgi:hypothetical protein
MEFESLQDKVFVFLHVLQTGSVVHPPSYLLDTCGSFFEGEAAGD